MISQQQVDALTAGRIGVFFQLETDPIVRLWLGVGDIAPGVNAFDPDGVIYHGMGEITDIPNWKQLVNATAERVEFRMSGVSGDILKIASGGDSEQVKGARVSVGYTGLDETWQPVGPIQWCANYTADFVGIQQAVTDDPMQPIVRSVTLSCGSLFTGRWRPGLAWWTDADEQGRHPGSRFCERVPTMANGFNMAWPVFD